MTSSQLVLFDLPPVAGASAIAREAESPQETRRAGLQAASLHKANLWSRMLTLYAGGPMTDEEMRIALRVDRSTVNARRNELIALGKVRKTGTSRVNPKTGVPNHLWGLV